MGLVDGHAYSLISAYEVTVNNKPVRLIKIRNPWGQKEWTGAWSDKSPLWTPELRKQLNAENANDGVFFISFEDYLKFFYVTTICKFIDGGDVSVVEDEQRPTQVCLSHFRIEKQINSTILITLNQLHHRFVHNPYSSEQYEYGYLRLSLVKIGK